MSKLELGQRVVGNWGIREDGSAKGVVVYRGDTGYLSPEYADNAAVKYVIHLATDDDDFLVLHDDGLVGYGYDGDGDYEAIED